MLAALRFGPEQLCREALILMFDGTLFSDMSLDTLRSEESVAMKLTSMSAGKRTILVLVRAAAVARVGR